MRSDSNLEIINSSWKFKNIDICKYQKALYWLNKIDFAETMKEYLKKDILLFV